jgi:ATP-dependent 26S proteasome regulatory subunit
MEERIKLWTKTLPKNIMLEKSLIQQLAANYELTGAQIVSAIMHASLLALGEESDTLSKQNLLQGVKAEYEKEERQFNPF